VNNFAQIILQISDSSSLFKGQILFKCQMYIVCSWVARCLFMKTTNVCLRNFPIKKGPYFGSLYLAQILVKINDFTSRNQPKYNQSIRNYMWLTVVCLDLGILQNFNYFGHSHNYDATIKNFILLVGSILYLFSSINRLICPISRNSHQISCILKVFYNDIGVYFNVCTKIIYIYIYIYKICIVCILFIKWISKLIFELWIFYSNLKMFISIV